MAKGNFHLELRVDGRRKISMYEIQCKMHGRTARSAVTVPRPWLDKRVPDRESPSADGTRVRGCQIIPNLLLNNGILLTPTLP